MVSIRSRGVGAAVVGALAGTLMGCASMDTTQAETRSIGGQGADSRIAREAPRGHQGVYDPQEVEVILAAANARQPVTGFSGHSELSAMYVGERDGCQAVTVENRNFDLTSHYAVCNGQITRRQEVAPARPGQGAFGAGPVEIDQAAVRSATDGALLYGSGRSQYQGYTYAAERVGVPDGNGCMPVELTVSHDGLLVDRSVRRICGE